MFEAYTDLARRAFLFGRYEASQCGSGSTEIDHIVLGLLRADMPLAIRLFKTQEKVDEIRARISRALPRKQPPVSVSSELPLSQSCKNALSYAAVEAGRRNQKLIAPEHLLMGILRDNTSVAAGIVFESGVTVSQLEEDDGKRSKARLVFSPSKEFASVRDLVSEADLDQAAPLTGRKRELDQLIQILSRRTRNSAVLIGEPGVGKDALVRDLARRIAEGDVPPDLADRPILLADDFDALHASQQKLSHIIRSGGPILYVPGLLDLRESMPALANILKRGKLQLITTAAPLSFRLAIDRNDELVRRFEFVVVPPPSDEDAVEMVIGAKGELEKFHGVAISLEAVQIAISGSGRFLPQRPLPERAIDLLDDAGAMVKLNGEVMPPELAEIRNRLRAVARERDQAIMQHDFDFAKKLSQVEKEQRDRFDNLQQEFVAARPTRTVSANDILEVIAARTSLTVDAVRSAMERAPLPDERTLLLGQLAARIPPGRRDWLEGLLAYLTDCSIEDADHLVEAIKTVKAKLQSIN